MSNSIVECAGGTITGIGDECARRENKERKEGSGRRRSGKINGIYREIIWKRKVGILIGGSMWTRAQQIYEITYMNVDPKERITKISESE